LQESSSTAAVSVTVTQCRLNRPIQLTDHEVHEPISVHIKGLKDGLPSRLGSRGQHTGAGRRARLPCGGRMAVTTAILQVTRKLVDQSTGYTRWHEHSVGPWKMAPIVPLMTCSDLN
jgi:hypothetical protein